MEELDPFWQSLYDNLDIDVSENFIETPPHIEICTINELSISGELARQIMIYEKTILEDKRNTFVFNLTVE
jgi:hypothetical protein